MSVKDYAPTMGYSEGGASDQEISEVPRARRQLKAQVSDVSMDEHGIPRMLLSPPVPDDDGLDLNAPQSSTLLFGIRQRNQVLGRTSNMGYPAMPSSFDEFGSADANLQEQMGLGTNPRKRDFHGNLVPVPKAKAKAKAQAADQVPDKAKVPDKAPPKAKVPDKAPQTIMAYHKMWYKSGNGTYGIRQTDGQKIQIFSVGAKGWSQSELCELADECLERLRTGASEDFVKQWVRKKLGK